MKIIYFILLFGLASSLAAAAQTSWHQVARLEIKDISSVANDSRNGLWVGTKSGHLYQLSDTVITASFRAQDAFAIDQLEAWQGLKILAFNEDFQTVRLFDRFLSRYETLDLAKMQDPVYISAVGLLPNNDLILFDQQGFSLIQMDMRNHQVKNKIALNSLSQLRSRLIHQIICRNKLIYLLGEKQIILLDQMGNLINTWPIEESRQIAVSNKKIYYLADGKCMMFDVEYQISKVVMDTIELETKGVIVQSDRLIMWTSNQLYFFKALNDSSTHKN